MGNRFVELSQLGRFPANLIHDNSEEVRECFPNNVKGEIGRAGRKSGGNYDASSYKVGVVTDTGFKDNGNASRFFKSIKQDLHCSLCYDIIDPYQLTKNICNNTNVNNVEKSLETTQATKESTALKNATGKVNESFVQNVKRAGNLCDLCGTSIAQRLVAIMQDQSQESTLGELSMPEHKKQILEKCLVSFVELRGNTDTIPTMENLNLLFGYVLNAIEEYTLKCEDTKSEDKNQWKSLIYKSKASKSERNKGCDGLEEKHKGTDLMVRTLWTNTERNHLSKVLSQKITDSNSICAEKYGFSPTLISFWKKGERIPTPETYEKLKNDYGLGNELDYIIYEHPKELTERTTILDNPTQTKSKNNHPTVKPIALMEYLIKMVTKPGGIVLDPFAGSGSTLVAAKQNGYDYIGIELTEDYIPIIKARLSLPD